MRIYYYDQKDNRQNVRFGIVFVIGTCILDYYICSI